MQYPVAVIQSLSHCWLSGFMDCSNTRLLCPLLSSRVCSNSWPLNQWHYLTISCLAPLLLLSVFPSTRVFCNDSTLLSKWPKYWSFSINTSKKYLGSISFRIDWFYLLAVQGTVKSLIQHYSSRVSVLWCWAFPTVQLSLSVHDYWKNHSFDYIDLCQ